MSELYFQLRKYVHFRTNTSEKSMGLLSPVKQSFFKEGFGLTWHMKVAINSIYKDDFVLKWEMKVDIEKYWPYIKNEGGY